MHYNERIKCDSLEINGDSIKKIKEMLLEKVFLTRFKNGMNDSDFFRTYMILSISRMTIFIVAFLRASFYKKT